MAGAAVSAGCFTAHDALRSNIRYSLLEAGGILLIYFADLHTFMLGGLGRAPR